MENTIKEKYDYEECDKLHDFIRKLKYKNNISNTAMHIYFSAMPEIEKLKTGFCIKTHTTYREISEYANVSIPSIGLALEQLNMDLCDIDIGNSINKGYTQTAFRRKTILELKENYLNDKILCNF